MLTVGQSNGISCPPFGGPKDHYGHRECGSILEAAWVDEILYGPVSGLVDISIEALGFRGSA